jgi:hypothetical protein
MAEPFLRLTILKKGRGWKFPDLSPAFGISVLSDARLRPRFFYDQIT